VSQAGKRDILNHYGQGASIGDDQGGRIDRLNALRAAIEVGTRELDAGLGEELDIESLIGEMHDEHAGRARRQE